MSLDQRRAPRRRCSPSGRRSRRVRAATPPEVVLVPGGVAAVDPDRHLPRAVLAGCRCRASVLAAAHLVVAAPTASSVSRMIPSIGSVLAFSSARSLRSACRARCGGGGRPVAAHALGSPPAVAAGVQRGELGVVGREPLGELEDDEALLDGRVVLHLPVQHDGAGAVAHRLVDPAGVGDVVRARAEHLLGDVRSGRGAATRSRRSRGGRRCGTGPRRRRVGDVTERAVEREGSRWPHRRPPCGRSCSARGPAGRSRGRSRRAFGSSGPGSRGGHPDAGGLHAAIGRQVGRAERQTLHPGRGGADLLDVGHAAGGLEDGVDEQRARVRPAFASSWARNRST